MGKQDISSITTKDHLQLTRSKMTSSTQVKEKNKITEEETKALYLQIFNNFFKEIMVQFNEENIKAQKIDEVKADVFSKTNAVLNQSLLPSNIKDQLQIQLNEILINVSNKIKTEENLQVNDLKEELIHEFNVFFDSHLDDSIIGRTESVALHNEIKDKIRSFTNTNQNSFHVIFILATLKAMLDKIHNDFSTSRLHELINIKTDKDTKSHENQKDIRNQALVSGIHVVALYIAGTLLGTGAIPVEAKFDYFRAFQGISDQVFRIPETTTQSTTSGSQNELDKFRTLFQNDLSKLNSDGDAKKNLDETFRSMVSHYIQSVEARA